MKKTVVNVHKSEHCFIKKILKSCILKLKKNKVIDSHMYMYDSDHIHDIHVGNQ